MNMKKKLWFKLFLIYLFTLALPLIGLTTLTTFLMNKQVYQNSSQLIYDNLNLVSVDVDATLKSAQYALNPLFSDDTIRKDLQSLVPSSRRKSDSDYLRVQEIMGNLNQCAAYNLSALSIDIYSINGQTRFSTVGNIYQRSIQNNYALGTSNWYHAFQKPPSNKAWLSIYDIYENEPQLVNYYPIMTDMGAKLVGIISVSVSRQSIENVISSNSFPTSGTLLITDVSGNLFMGMGPLNYQEYRQSSKHTSVNYLGATTATIDGKEYYIYQTHSSSSLLNYIYILPSQKVSTSNFSVVYIVIAFIFVLSMLSFAVITVVHYIVSPIVKLFKAMEVVQQGDLSIRLKESRQDEIGMINHHFNNMTENLEKLIEENYRIGISKKEFELKFVISQINEHFLYNTLDAINWSARKSHNSDIIAVVSHLSRFYRNVLSSGQDIVTVECVGDMIESYLYIQKFRMQERLNYTVEFAPEIKQCKVLKYLFQPLVENAILHGVAKRKEGGHVSVRLETVDERLRFSVKDDGVGMSHDKLTQLLMDIYVKDSRSDLNRNFALRNINTQLSLHYGEVFYLHIESTKDMGTMIWFEVPMEP